MNRSREDVDFDQSAYDAADAHFRRVSKLLPEDAIANMSRQVVRRLAFRMPRELGPDHQPSEDEVAQLVMALLSDDDRAGDKIILAAQSDGVAARTLYLGYVAAAARRLGVMWEEDEVSFVDVTVASGRLYRTLRGLRHLFETKPEKRGEDSGKPVLLALVPGEVHTLGIEMATDLFRRDGWDVKLSVGADIDTIATLAEDMQFNAVILVASSEKWLSNLVATVVALRIVTPNAYILVAGNILNDVKNVREIVGADDIIHDIEGATGDLRKILAPKGDGATH